MASKTYRYTVNVADTDHAGSFLIQQNFNGGGWTTYASETALGQYELIAVFDDTQHNTIQARVKDQDGNISNVLTKNIVKTGIAGDLLKPADGFTDVWSDTVYNYTKLGWDNATDAVQYRAKLDYERSDNGAALSSSYDNNPNNSASGEVNIVMSQPEGVYIRILNNVTLQYTSDGTNWIDLESHSVTLFDPNASVINPQLTSPADGATFSDTFEAFGWATANNQGYTHFRTVASWSGGSSTGSITTGSGQNLISLPDAGEAVTVQLQAGTQDDPGFEAVVVDTHLYTASTSMPPAEFTSPAALATLTGTTETVSWSIGADTDATNWQIIAYSGGVQFFIESAGSGTATSHTVTGIPDDGSVILFELYRSIGVVQTLRDSVTVTAHTRTTAFILTPASATTVSGTTQVITWDINQDTDATNWQIRAYSNGVQFFIESTGSGTATSHTVTGIPEGGETILIELYHSFGLTQSLRDSVSITAGTGVAETKALLTSPSVGQTLTSASHTFQWSASTFTDVDHYAVNVMDVNNSYATVAANWSIPFGTNQVALTGLPTDGRQLHVKLYERDSGGTELRSDEFAITAYTSTGASFVSPTAGGTLAGAASDITVLDNTNSALYSVIRVYDNTTQALLVTSPSWAETAAQHTFSLTGLPTDGRSLRLEYWEDQSGDNNLDTKVSEIVVNAYNASGGGTLTAQTTQITATASQVIEGLCFDGFGNNDLCIYVPATASNVTIRNCSFKNSVAVIKSDNAANLTIEECLFHDVGKGIYLLGCSNPVVRKNTFTRFGVYDVRNHTDSMGWSGNAIQFNTCTTDNSAVNCDQNIIDANYSTATVTDLSGHGWWVDAISAFACSGTSFTNMFKMNGNIIRGIKSKGTQAAGAMIAGDSGGNYVEMDGNKILNFGQYGIGLAPITNSKVTNNLSYLEQGHGFDVGDGTGTFKLIKHPSDGANANGGFGFVFSGFGGGSCSNNDIHGNDFMGFTQWGWKPTAEDSVNSSGGTVNNSLPSWDHGGGNAGTCTDTDYSGNNVSSSLASHPNLTAMAAEDPYTTVATAANGYFDRTQTCS